MPGRLTAIIVIRLSGPLSFILPLLFLTLCSRVRIDLAPPATITPTATPQPAATAPARATPLPTPTSTPVPMPIVTVSSKIICALPNLAEGQHLSAGGSYLETQWAASGLMACRIERDTCAYNRLVGLLDPTIVFKQEEESPYDTEDILMHPAMLDPLSRLSRLVLAEWDGRVQLRVTDAYDSLLEHDLGQPDPNRKYSLHFEGRAIDLTTWPLDRSRYGRLCALAHCAGFDWVHHEGSHCHASIKAKSLCLLCGQ